MRHALLRLPPDDRALVTLFYEEECPIAEIARMMNLSQANVKVACRILPALKDFAGCTQHPPRYFARVYPDWGEQCLQWDETLRQMIEAFSYLRDFNQKYDREGLGKAQVGLHLFAEYLQEMYNL